MKKILLITILLFSLLYLLSSNKASAIKIPDEAIRIRVIANSNSPYDQSMKMKVSDNIQKEMYTLLIDAKSINEGRKIIKNNIDNINNNVKVTLQENNYQIPYHISFGQNYFPEKIYKGIKYKEGYYESLVITLGKGEGDNWWCVLFPPLCLLEAEESDDVEYQIFIKELINKYF